MNDLYENVNDLLKKATNGMKVTQSPMRPSAAKQQRQVMAPPRPPNNPPSPAAPARSGGGNGVLKNITILVFVCTTTKVR